MMNAKGMGPLIVGLALGLIGGGASVHFAQSRGLLPEWTSTAARSGSAEHAEHQQQESEYEDRPRATGHDDEHDAIRMSPEVMREFGIDVAQAAGGRLEQTIALPGEVVTNADRLAHIVPRVSGVVREVHTSLGDQVVPGHVMAVLESRELAEAKAGYLAAVQRLALAQANLAANDELRAKGIVADLEFLAARRDRSEAEIEIRAAEHKLHALGLTDEQVESIEREHDQRFSIYELRAPFVGTVIDKHITLGEIVTPETDVFVLADLSNVWVHLTVYQKDLPHVRLGQAVTVVSRENDMEGRGKIDYLSPAVEEATRTATARVTLENADRRWRPGLFITGHIEVEEAEVSVLVPKTALQTIEDRPTVFVLTEEGFVPRPVSLGRSNPTYVEILEGLKPGERYAVGGAFTLKAELLKATFAGEGHAH